MTNEEVFGIYKSVIEQRFYEEAKSNISFNEWLIEQLWQHEKRDFKLDLLAKEIGNDNETDRS